MNSIIDFIRQVAISIASDYIQGIIGLVTLSGFGIIIIRVNPSALHRIQQLRDKILSFIWRKRASLLILLLALIVVLFFLWFKSITPSASGKTLKAVQNRGELRCGVNINLQGMGATIEGSLSEEDTSSLAKVTSNELDHHELSPTQVEGLDVDFCRAVAAAIFGAEASQSKWRAVYFKDGDRLNAVKKGSVDVSFRNTSWTSKRDLLEGVDFGPPNFYDQLTILINNKRKEIDSTGGARALLSGRKICVAKGTTSHDNMQKLRNDLQKDPSKKNINFELITTRRDSSIDIEDTPQAFDAFFAGECDSIASDRSRIVAKLYTQDEDFIKNHLIYGDNSLEVTSVELLSPVIPEGDDAWKNLISHVIFTTIYAEDIGVSQKDVKNSRIDGFKIENFLRPQGKENYWESLEIQDNQFPALSIIASVGNYGEIFDRNLAKIYEKHLNTIYRPSKKIPNSEIYIQELRGPNRLIKNGGVLVSPQT